MKISKFLVAILLLMSTNLLSAQEEAELTKRSEIKVNALYLLLGGFELDYEYILNEESSIGLSATVFFDDVDYNWGITPHYRLFFGKEPALGFFVEGHAAVYNVDYYFYDYGPNGGFNSGMRNRTTGGIGIAVGGKFKTRRDVVVEVNGGIGRIFGNDNFDTVYPRFGINIGKRF